MRVMNERDIIIVRVLAILMLFLLYGGALYLAEQYVGFWVGMIFAILIIVMLKNSIKEVIQWRQKDWKQK